MKLYIAPGACSLSPHIMLRELDLPFELETVDFREKRTRSGEDYRSINPKGYVPALEIDSGEVLTEGVAIVQFLVDSYAPGQFAPLSGTKERAELNAHLNFFSAELHKAVGPLFNPALGGADRDAALQKAKEKLAILEAALADGRAYLMGEDFSIADVYLYVIASWAPRVGIDLAATAPRVSTLVQRVQGRTAVQAALAAEAELRAAA